MQWQNSVQENKESCHSQTVKYTLQEENLSPSGT